MTIQKSVKKTFLKMLDPGSPFLFTSIARPVSRLVIPFLLVTATTVTLAQPGNNAPAGEVIPEEINVYAEMSLRKLRLETNRAQEAMFNVFNDLNSDDRFDIQCGYVQRRQSKIREYECSPFYLKTAREQEVNLFLSGIRGEGGNGEATGFAGAQSGGAGLSQLDHFNALLEEDMKTVIREHPEFQQAMDKYNVIREYYDARLSGSAGE